MQRWRESCRTKQLKCPNTETNTSRYPQTIIGALHGTTAKSMLKVVSWYTVILVPVLARDLPAAHRLSSKPASRQRQVSCIEDSVTPLTVRTPSCAQLLYLDGAFGHRSCLCITCRLKCRALKRRFGLRGLQILRAQQLDPTNAAHTKTLRAPTCHSKS